jgi:hypothetical protein
MKYTFQCWRDNGKATVWARGLSALSMKEDVDALLVYTYAWLNFTSDCGLLYLMSWRWTPTFRRSIMRSCSGSTRKMKTGLSSIKGHMLRPPEQPPMWKIESYKLYFTLFEFPTVFQFLITDRVVSSGSGWWSLAVLVDTIMKLWAL